MPDFQKLSSGLSDIKTFYNRLCQQAPSRGGVRRILSLLFSFNFVPGDEGKQRYARFCLIVDKKDETSEWRLAQLCQFYFEEKHTSRLVLELRKLMIDVFDTHFNHHGMSIHAQAITMQSAIYRTEDAMRHYIAYYKKDRELDCVLDRELDTIGAAKSTT